MKLVRRAVGAALGATLIVALPAPAQNRALVIGAFGGGYTHVNNLNAPGSPNADFRGGYNVGATVGIKLNNLVSLHSDLTFARNRARGISSFAGADVSRLFYGAHVELSHGFTPAFHGYVFAGGGVIRVEQASPEQFTPFSKPAGMVGLGAFLSIPGTELDLMLESQSLIYKWDRAGFDKNLWDVTYSVGLAYRVPLP